MDQNGGSGTASATVRTEVGEGVGSDVRLEVSAKRVRAYLGGQLVVESTEPRLVWEIPEYPAYYFPAADVRAELHPTDGGHSAAHPTVHAEYADRLGAAQLCDVRIGQRTAAAAARRYPDSPVPELRTLVRFEWDALDEWLEEDDPVYVHPHNPYARIDVLTSSRHVQVLAGGLTVADSRRPCIVFETGAPPRYYLPMSDVRMDLLQPTQTTTGCAYKGFASYWSLDTGAGVLDDVVWGYRTPLPEAQKIAGMVSFYNEKVDISVDGLPQHRPQTEWS